VKVVWEVCEPRKEVLSGRIKSDIFAAKLGEVTAGNAPDVYQKPGLFFENTYPTSGLKPPSQCTCGEPRKPLVGEGTPAKAFTQLADACADGKVETLATLAIQAGVVEDVRRLALAISQLPGTLPHVRQTFSGTQQDDRLDLSFDGGWKTFGAVQKFVEGISKQLPDNRLDTTLRIQFDPPVKPAGDEIARLRKAIEDMQVGTIKLSAQSGGKT